MATRQEGIEKKMLAAGVEISNLTTPGIAPSPKSVMIAKISAKALTETKDSGLVTITNNLGVYSFTHGLGYTPSVNLIIPQYSGNLPYIKDINDQTVTISVIGSTSSPTIIRIICH